MKIAAIRSICMEAKTMNLFTNAQGAVCWIGTGSAAYRCDLNITEDDVQSLFALTNKQMDKLKVCTVPITDTWLDGAGALEEQLTDKDMLDVNINGSVACFLTDERAVTIWAYDKRLTKPIPACDDRTWVLTQNNKDEALFIIYNGAEAAAIIKPVHRSMVSKLTELLGHMAQIDVGLT